MRWVTSLLFVSCILAQEIRVVPVATGITAPTDIQNAGDGSGRLFLVQQNGMVRILRDGAVLSTAFLDIRSKTVADGERGLLGLAFPPGYAQKQRFYVDYTDLNGNTVIAMYRVSANPDLADAASETILLRITQPFANHNGGQVRFGLDGYLYIGMGDGGSAGDPQGNGQNLGTLLGKLLRIDVESSPGQVRVPPDNPFVNTAGARGEIWAYGLRNPWRFSFDRATQDLWIADVGQGNWEEIDRQPAFSKGGENYGWNRMEGTHCFTSGCNPQGLVPPVTEYSHAGGACSVTGASVYRGNRSPGLRGTYIYGDYCTGVIWGLERTGTSWTSRVLLNSGFNLTTFGEDESGEIYVANARSSAIFRIEGGRAPRFAANAVVNPASFAAGMVAGSLATVFGAGFRDEAGSIVADSVPLPSSLGGISVTVDGIPAPVYSLSNVGGQEQISFQAPWGIAGRPVVPVAFTRDGEVGPAAQVTVLSAQPGVYTSDGSSAIVVRAADYSLGASRGDYVFVYASGLGTVSNAPPDGQGGPLDPLARTVSEVRAALGGQPCEVQYAGLAPGFAGVYQVNFRVPAGAAVGSQDLVLTVAGASSPAVKVAVQ